MTDPHIWWYVTRASALVAWALMTISVVWGILLSTRLLRGIDSPSWLQDLHSYVSGASIVMTVLHMVSLMLDGWLKFSALEVLVPFATDYRPLAVALGIIAFYLLVAVQASSLLVRRLPRTVWRVIHYLSFLVVLLVAVHAGLTGTDVSAWGYRVYAFTLIGIALAAVLIRVGVGRAETRAGRRALVEAPVARPLPDENFRLARRVQLTDDIIGLRLEPLDGQPLPIWSPGSHLTLYLPTGLQRHYSLAGDPADRGGYEIAVLRTTDSEGGSVWLHEEFYTGMGIAVGAPSNQFELEPATEYLFVAGGIGITPVRGMIESLPARRDWRLLYIGRSRTAMAFADALAWSYPDRVTICPTDERDARDALRTFLDTRPAAAMVYACGPAGMLDDVAARVPAELLRLERFVPLDRTTGLEPQAVTLRLKRTGVDLLVPPEQPLLDALEERGIPVLGSCRKGVCGSCEVRVISGVPQHLDSVMSDADKDKHGVMYPCVSRASSAELVLDL